MLADAYGGGRSVMGHAVRNLISTVKLLIRTTNLDKPGLVRATDKSSRRH